MVAEWAFDDNPGRASIWLAPGRVRSVVALLLALAGPSAATYAVVSLALGRFQGVGFVAAVVVAALVGRLLAGFIAFLATAGLIVYFVLPPAGFAWLDAHDTADLVALLGVCAFLAVVVSALQRARSAALIALAMARRAEQRLTVLARASAAMSASFDLAAASRQVCELVVRAGGWEHCAVVLEEDRGAAMVLASSAATEPRRPRRWWPQRPPRLAPVESIPLPTGLRSPQTLDPGGVVHRIGPWTCRSGVLMPLLVDGGAVGSLVLLHVSRGLSYGPAELAFASELASRLSGAIAADRRYAAEAEIAQTLQRNLLPRQLPDVPGVHVHAAYHAGGRTVAGGDFYDLFPIDDGRWMVVVGDVCGKGPEAASVMGIARASLRAIALREHSPARLMALVNDALRDQVADHRFVSACAAVLEPQPDGSVAVTMCRAGHPPAVARRADGVIELVGAGGGPVLGVLADVEFSEDKFVLNPDDRLVLYTDGIERPGDPPDEVALRLVRQHGADSPDAIAERFADAMRAGSDGKADDLAVMVLTISTAPKTSFSGRMRDMVHRLGVL